MTKKRIRLFASALAWIVGAGLLVSSCNLLPQTETTAARSEDVEEAVETLLDEITGGDFADNDYTSDVLDDDAAEDFLEYDEGTREVIDELLQQISYEITASTGTEDDEEGSCDISVTVVDLKSILKDLDDDYVAEDVIDAITDKKAPTLEEAISLELTFDDDWLVTDASELFALILKPVDKLEIAVPTETTEATETTAAAETTAANDYVTDLEITIAFSFGDYEGIYTGDMVGGLPEGFGTFESYEPDGTTWYYTGNWVAGHMEGEGLTYWDTGWTETGTYVGDKLNGYGEEYTDTFVVYQGNFVDNEYDGFGTYYDSNGEIVFEGNWTTGFIAETADERAVRVQAFKDTCSPMSAADMITACETFSAAHVQFSGTILQVYVYDDGYNYYCDFLLYVDGVEDTAQVVEVYYRLSSGEIPFVEDQTVTVWGSTQSITQYTSEGGEEMYVPNIEARSVE